MYCRYNLSLGAVVDEGWRRYSVPRFPTI